MAHHLLLPSDPPKPLAGRQRVHCKRQVASPWHVCAVIPHHHRCPTCSIPTCLAEQSRVMLPTNPSRFPPWGLGTKEQARGSLPHCLCTHRTYPPACTQSIGDEPCHLEEPDTKAFPTVNPPTHSKPKLLGERKQALWVRKLYLNNYKQSKFKMYLTWTARKIISACCSLLSLLLGAPQAPHAQPQQLRAIPTPGTSGQQRQSQNPLPLGQAKLEGIRGGG